MIVNTDAAAISGAITQSLLYQFVVTQCRMYKKSLILRYIKFS